MLALHITQVEKTETSQKSTEKDSRRKEDAIITLEADLRNTKQNLGAMEAENTQLKNR